MSIKIKPRTYYKRYYDKDELIWEDEYDILYTYNELVYFIAYKHNGELIKHDNRIEYGTIKNWQACINSNDYKLEEISKEDLFLELL